MRLFTQFCCLGVLAFIAGPLIAQTSSFDLSAEGWTAEGDSAAPVAWHNAGGNPGGYISITDAATGGTTYFVAPTSFLGNHVSAYGTGLTFDLRQQYSGSANQFNAVDVILVGAGLTIVYDTSTNPSTSSWSSYTAPLSESVWHLGALTGSAPSAAQFKAVLADLDALKIRAEYQTGGDVGFLDNVTLVPEPSTYSLFLAGFCVLFARLTRKTRKA
jgi:hypothetical protein